MFEKVEVANIALEWLVENLLDIPKDIALKKIKKNNEPPDYTTQLYGIINKTIGEVFGISDKEKLAQMAELFLRQLLKEKGATEESVQRSLNIIDTDGKVRCSIFLERLSTKIARNQELTNWIMLNENSSMLPYLKNRFNIVLDKLGEKEKQGEAVSSTRSLKLCDDKQYFIDEKWNARLFLHTKEDDRPLTLANTFIFPEYNDSEKIDDIYDDLEETLKSFVNRKKKSKILIILGVPGMGKTSITAWLANEYIDNDDIILLRFRKLRNINESKNLLFSISERLGREIEDLEYKTLILDGYDELPYGYNMEALFEKFLLDVKSVEGLRIIVTSRQNYIATNILEQMSKCALYLRPYSQEKIHRFYENIMNEKLPNVFRVQNENVLGVPVILYMALSVGIDITEDKSKCELFEKIFSRDSGIYRRFGTITEDGYELGTHEVERYRHDLHRIMQLLAFTLFENGDPIELKKKDYIKIIQFVMGDETWKKKIIFDFPIRNLYSEDNKIEFVHKSIYEYFVAEYMYQQLVKVIKENPDELAKVLGRLLKKNELSEEICEFLRYKMRLQMFGYYRNAFECMLENGMTFYTNECYRRVIERERCVFYNLLEIIHFWEFDEKLYLKGLVSEIKLYAEGKINLSNMRLQVSNISDFSNLRGVDLNRANLRGTDLSEVDLNRANLREADLREAILNKADLSEANLSDADLDRARLNKAKLIETKLRGATLNKSDLREANLREADLREANLTEADLRKVDLREAKLNGADLYRADLRGTDLRGANLYEADLRGANLKDIRLDTSVNFGGVMFDNYTLSTMNQQYAEYLIKTSVYDK